MGGVTIGLGVLHLRFILGDLSKPAWGGDKVFRPKKLRPRGSAVQKVESRLRQFGANSGSCCDDSARPLITTASHRVGCDVLATHAFLQIRFLADRASIIFRLREPTRMDEQAASCPSTSLRLRTTLAPAQFPQ